MDSKALKEEVESGLPPIYFCNIDVAYKKGKKRLVTHNGQMDIVSRYNTIQGIHADHLTMQLIKTGIYGGNYKGQKHVMVKKVNSSKIIGHVNSNAI
jgi:hypothetical protein